MIRERVADDVYIFTSEIYANVNAGAIVGPEWSVVIDTLAYPEESQEIQDFIENRIGSPVRYLVNTHHHADHTLGNHWFPDAIIVSHELCRGLLDSKGRQALSEAKQQNRELSEIEIVLPDVTFNESEIGLRTGKRTLQLIPLPGHSIDGIGVLVVEDRVLFSGDIMMPVPYLIDGNIDVMTESMKLIPKLKLENLVQGHGEVILRGEVPVAVKSNLNYISAVMGHAKKALRRKDPEGYLNSIDVESCGKARILLNGLAEELHRRNLIAMYQRHRDERGK
jgi:glyoxylase-like metal-dependent hydrolase (beta-lactamase superfamily II)